MRLWLICGAVLGWIGVAAGSFGAHGLKGLLEANGQAANWETAVRYCLFHAIALLIVGLWPRCPRHSQPVPCSVSPAGVSFSER